MRVHVCAHCRVPTIFVNMYVCVCVYVYGSGWVLRVSGLRVLSEWACPQKYVFVYVRGSGWV